MSWRVFRVAALLLLLAFATLAQSRPVTEPSKPPPEDPEQRREPEMTIPEEMRTRLLIERAEDEHRKLVADVKQLGELTSELAKQYRERNRLVSQDLKKLGTIEKLARRVLSKALGKEEKPDLPPQLSVAEAVDQLDSAAQKIRKVITSETRFVVSATVIANSNEVISLAERIRQTQKR